VLPTSTNGKNIFSRTNDSKMNECSMKPNAEANFVTKRTQIMMK